MCQSLEEFYKTQILIVFGYKPILIYRFVQTILGNLGYDVKRGTHLTSMYSSAKACIKYQNILSEDISVV